MSKYNYTYNGIKFDSSWELALWIYAKDHNEKIRRLPKTLSYNVNGISKRYFVDFLYNGKYVEIKGKQLLDNENHLVNYKSHKRTKEQKAKEKCLKENEVILLTKKEIEPVLKYISEKYGKNYLQNFRTGDKSINNDYINKKYYENNVFLNINGKKNKKMIYNKIQHLYLQNKIKRIKNGLYILTNPITNEPFYVNKYEIGTAMFSKAYIGYHTALEYYGLYNQMSREVQVMVEKPEREVEFENVKYKFYIGDNKFVEQRDRLAITRVTSLEKTIYDCMNNIKYAGGLEELFMAIETIDEINEAKLLKILKYYNDDKMYQKIGWLFYVAKKDLLSDNFYKLCKSKVKVFVDLRDNKKCRSKFFREWQIVAQKHIFWKEEYKNMI